MLFTLPRLQVLLTEPSAQPNCQAKLDNLACEERIGGERLKSYQDHLKNDLVDDSPFYGAPNSWAALHERYFRHRVAILDSATFTQASDLTARATIAEEDWIIRVERLDGAFRDWEGDPSGKSAIEWLKSWAQTLMDAVAAPAVSRVSSMADIGALMGKPSKPKPPSTVEELFHYWNTFVRKDHRPSFVAFEAELTEELKASDWPTHLCVRLGLGHHFTDNKIILGVLRYPVKDILVAWKGSTCFCAPTVLDSNFGEYFHPSPQGCDWGFAAVLDPGAGDDALVAELLHRRIDYRPEHLWRVGVVNRSPIDDGQLVALRNAHISRLRRQSGRDDFGITR